MVFSSIPAYLDPTNWHQGGNDEQIPPAQGGSIRPGSMVERARMANIPMPEAALKCPRCDSTNTKFCYFNNYSLSQPRHFCKTCRRYWTRGGAMRSVPVGGGCRRNKRASKPPKSPTADHVNVFHRFITPLHHTSLLYDNNNNNNNNASSFTNYNVNTLLGTDHLASSSHSLLPVGLGDQWRSVPHFPFLGGGEHHPKMEDIHQYHPLVGLGNGNGNGNDQFWTAGAAANYNAWTDLSAFTSSSTSQP